MAPEDGEITSPASAALTNADAAAEAARSRAETARARATELRLKADEARTAEAEAAAAAEAAQAYVADAEACVAEQEIVDPPDNEAVSSIGAAPERMSRPVQRSRRPLIAAVVGVFALGGLIAASGYLVHTHRQTTLDRQRSAEYTAAARQGVVNLMAINFNTADADVQRVLESATGEFKSDFQNSSKDLIGAMKEAKIITEVSVEGVAVESMTPDSAVVLVAATTQRGSTDAKGRDPRTWRVVVTVSRENDQLKMSKVDYV